MRQKANRQGCRVPDFVNRVTRYCPARKQAQGSGAMALPSGIGRFFRFLRPRFGVKGSLFAAFAVIAGMAIIISAGAAMVFATRSFYRIDGAPFIIHCDRFARAITRINERSVSFTLDGPSGLDAHISLVAGGGPREAFEAQMWDSTGQLVAPDRDAPDVLCRFSVAAQGAYTLGW